MGLKEAMENGWKFLEQEKIQEANRYFKIDDGKPIVDWELFVQQHDREIQGEVLNQAHDKEILCYPQEGSIFLYDEDGSIKTLVNPITGTVYHFSPKREDEAKRYQEAKYPNQELGLAKLIKPVI